jgi:hypothetical protein
MGKSFFLTILMDFPTNKSWYWAFTNAVEYRRQNASEQIGKSFFLTILMDFPTKSEI